MTDEVQNTETTMVADATPAEENNVNISVEQILAAILKVSGKVNVPFADLVSDYSTFNIAVTQNEDKSVDFELTEVQASAEAESTSETAE